ncbi:protein MEI2-like 4 isoform X1 [Amaranthus tricolor]|uniref:protein MEI2-like 4 isoform X1 n=2 Tax=Amaranthus tricolor TaxID=29722 RepID=UPI00258F4D07|nr:protein MEI2-like 4 isoform X1 [Amaranthus tricolor]XP_057542449.1 protein MEI2-like 4 isoform X1 [Amaranthus tricolor]
MPSQLIDQQGMSASPYFSGDLQFCGERQVGFWKTDSLRTNYGMKTDAISGTPPMEKLVAVDSQATKYFEVPEQKVSFNLQKHSVGAERAVSRSLNIWSSMDLNPITRASPNVNLSCDKNTTSTHFENGLFSSSMSELFSRKLHLSSSNFCGNLADTVASHYDEEEPFQSLEEMEAQTIGNLLPDDDDLFSGVVDGIRSKDDAEDLDFFSSVGGMDLGDDTSSVKQRNSEFSGISNGQKIGANNSVYGEHPFGEQPSRTLFVRNINSNVEDHELQALFEQYGDIRNLYTSCKHRGFVMVSYFDIRAARNAMKALQDEPLRRRRLDIHYSIPKDNTSEKDVNQGILLVSNLDSSVSSDALRQIFGAYGEVKEIRETPHKSNQKLIEFYDVRSADEALQALNKSDIAGKKVKVEPIHPGGARRSSTQLLGPDLEQEESGLYVPQRSAGFSYGSISSTGIDSDTGCGTSFGMKETLGSFRESSSCHGISSSVPSGLPSLLRAETSRSQAGLSGSRTSVSQIKHDFQGLPTLYPHSLPDYNDRLTNGVPCSSDRNILATDSSFSNEGFESTHFGRINSGFTSGIASGSRPGHPYAWSNSNNCQPPAFMWPNSPSLSNGFCNPQTQLRFHGLPRSPSHILNSALPMNRHHVGSAPAVNHSLWDRWNSYSGESPETSIFHQGPLRNMRLSGSPLNHIDFGSPNMFPHAGGNSMDLPISSRNVGLHAHNQRGMIYPSRGQMNMVGSFEHPGERTRSRRSENISSQADNKKQYELDIERISRGEDNRTTLMIKNIPNKYTSKMLMGAIDERHRGTYDFIYLPIDFKNKCNVGYAFINMVDPSHIVPLYETLNGKKWEKFNSEKVASLAYARIQGKAALVAHFQNSSLMNEDKRCRPILFHSDGTNAGDQVPFPMGVNIRSRPSKSTSSNNEDDNLEILLTSKDEYFSADSSSSSGKELD